MYRHLLGNADIVKRCMFSFDCTLPSHEMWWHQPVSFASPWNTRRCGVVEQFGVWLALKTPKNSNTEGRQEEKSEE